MKTAYDEKQAKTYFDTLQPGDFRNVCLRLVKKIGSNSWVCQTAYSFAEAKEFFNK